MNTENKNPEIQLAISVKTLAKMLSVSKRQIHRLRACGKIGPDEIRLGGSIRYRYEEVVAWVNSDPSCVDRQTWKARKGGNHGE